MIQEDFPDIVGPAKMVVKGCTNLKVSMFPDDFHAEEGVEVSSILIEGGGERRGGGEPSYWCFRQSKQNRANSTRRDLPFDMSHDALL